MRWRLADDEVDGQPTLFGAHELVGPQPGTGRLSGLEFLPVTTRRIINTVPASSRVPFRHTINVYRGCSHGCHYCFARPTHAYLDLNIGSDFDSKIVVKINAVERLRAELSAPSWTGEMIAMGTNTDPYQRCEGKFRLTRGVVEVLTERANPFSILTKSALVTRDLDLLRVAAKRTDISVNFSIGTLDERVWRATEPGTPHPRRRLDALRQMAEAGIPCGALIAPILPGLSDSPAQLAEVARAVAATGGRILGVLPLHLRPPVRGHFLGWLRDFDADLHAKYLRHYANGSYAPQAYTDRLRGLVERAAGTATPDPRLWSSGSPPSDSPRSHTADEPGR